MKYLIMFSYLFLAVACTDKILEESVESTSSNLLFEKIDPVESGVDFTNRITETANLNGILYEYLYNGGGVAVGDLNGDDLPDLYFISNLESNQLYLNQGKLKFKNITSASGTSGGRKGFPTGVSLVDINADGQLDIYICKAGMFGNPDLRRNQLFVNQGNNQDGIPIFKEEAEKYNLDLEHHATQAAFFDYDRDGDLDMFLINHGPRIYEDQYLLHLKDQPAPLQSEQLYRNDDGVFVNVSAAAGLIDNALSFGLGVAIGDLNNDGWQDVLVSHDFSQKDHLYINQQNGRFKEEMTSATNHVSFYSMGNEVADFNNDGRMDFMTVDMVGDNNYDIKTSMSGMNPQQFYNLVDNDFHHQYMFNCLQLNRGDLDGIPRFSDVAQIAGVSNTDWSWAPLFFDVDNDGFKDLFVANGVKRDFRNNDYVRYKQDRFNEFFRKHTENTRDNKLKARAMSKELIEMMPTRKKPNYFFKNTNGLIFEKRQWIEHEANASNGAVYSDLDGDGDLDLVLNNMDDPASIYENKATSLGNHFVQIKLKGSQRNPSALGARVTLTTKTGKQIVENQSARGFQSSSLGNIHFGLAHQDKIQMIEILWPDGKYSQYHNVDIDKVLEVDYEGSIQRQVKNIQKSTVEFVDITTESKVDFIHSENEFDDFGREGLLPHRMSRFGPALAVADVNGDGLQDFYAGGALGQSGELYFQDKSTQFYKESNEHFEAHSAFEDVDALFFDMDNDNDQDLYVVSGGSEYDSKSGFLKDRIYENIDGVLIPISISALPNGSGGRVKVCDYDKDGDLDMVVTGRQVPGNYPFPATTYILENNSSTGSISFTLDKAYDAVGMVTDAEWIDIDMDGWQDLVLVGEWMSPLLISNELGGLSDSPVDFGLENEVGWWFSIASGDFDSDGDVDFVAGNNGLNFKYKAAKGDPFEIYADDFDQNGNKDIVLAYEEDGIKVPLRGRECTSNEMPFVKQKFGSYDAFGKATLADVYGEKGLSNALHYQATNFASCLFENNGKGDFVVKPLPQATQLSATNAILVDDFNLDGNADLLMAGNFFVSEVETPRNDAGFGTILLQTPEAKFAPLHTMEANLFLNGDVRQVEHIRLASKEKGYLIANNDGALQLIKLQ